MSEAPIPSDSVVLAEDLQAVVAVLVRQMRAVAEPGLTLSQVTLLKRLDSEGPATSAALARAERITPQAVFTTTSTLLEAGLIQRSPHPTDRRGTLLDLTDAGRAFLADRTVAGYSRLADLIDSELTAAERKTLTKAVGLLRRLTTD